MGKDGNTPTTLMLGKSSSQLHLQSSFIPSLHSGRFSMVCRDAHTNTARTVPPLLLTTPEETHLNSIGAEHKKRQRQEMMQGLDRVPPSGEEMERLHGMMLSVGKGKDKGNGKGEGTGEGEKVVHTKETEVSGFGREKGLKGERADGGGL